MRIVDRTTGRVIAEDAEVARGVIAALRGLIGRREFRGGAFVLPGCRQVHTFFMRFPIDIVYLSPDGTVLCVDQSLPPWRIGRRCAGAACGVELPQGAVERNSINPGDVWAFEQAADPASAPKESGT